MRRRLFWFGVEMQMEEVVDRVKACLRKIRRGGHGVRLQALTRNVWLHHLAIWLLLGDLLVSQVRLDMRPNTTTTPAGWTMTSCRVWVAGDDLGRLGRCFNGPTSYVVLAWYKARGIL